MLRANFVSACQRNDAHRFSEITKVPNWIQKVEINEYVYVLDTQMYNKCSLPRTTFLCITSEHASAEFVEQLLKHGAKTGLCDGFNDNPLHKACRSTIDPLRKVQLLLQYDKELNQKTNKNKVAPIHVAATKSDPTICTALLQHGADINLVTNKQLTPLHIASHFGRIETVKTLLNQPSADVNLPDINGDTPLHHAANHGYPEILNLLKSHPGCFPFLTNNEGRTADQENRINFHLLFTAQRGTLYQVKTLLDRGALCVKDENGKTPLHKACASTVNALEKVELLINADRSQIYTQSKSKTLPIHVAAKNDDQRVLKYLIPGSKLNLKTAKGFTPLHVAVWFGKTQNVELLCSLSDIDVNARDSNGNTPAHLAVQREHPEVLAILQKHSKYNEYIVNNKGETVVKDKAIDNVLLVMAENNTLDVVNKVISAGAKINTTDKSGNTVLHKACGSNLQPIDKCKLFLEKDPALINIPNNKEEVPLHVAVRRFDSQVTRFLLENPNIDVNKRNKSKHAPLHIAVIRNNEDNTKALLEHPKIKINLQDNRAETACHIAATYKRTSLLRMLQSRPDCIIKVRNTEAKTPSQIWCPHGAVTDLTENVDLEWHQHKTVAIIVPRLSLIDGNLYCCNEIEYYISVYNHEFEEIERIHTDGLVYDVAALSSGQLVIAQHNGLYLRSSPTGDVKRITSGWHYSVATHNDKIYTTMWYDNPTVIHVYENITLQERSTISLPCTLGHRVTLHVTSTSIYACCRAEHKLYVLRHDDTLVDTHGRHGRENAGDLDRPFLCHTGDNDALLIADRVNHRLQVLDTERRWSIVRTQPPLYRPRTAVYAPGRLYVISYNRDKQQPELKLFLPRNKTDTNFTTSMEPR